MAGEDNLISDSIVKPWQMLFMKGQAAEECFRKYDFAWDSKEQLQLMVIFI